VRQDPFDRDEEVPVGRLVVSEFVSLDGIVEDPGGAEGFARGGWAFKFSRGEEGDRYKLDEVLAADAMLLGRLTYEGFAAAWPSVQDELGFAEKMNSMPKYVVSSTRRTPDWNNTTVVRADDLAATVRELEARYEGDLLVAGSARLVGALLAEGLVDELRLMVFPIVLGEGKRLFGTEAAGLPLRLVDSRPVGDDGVLILTYAPGTA
jgi:dihydrofolate reductase